MKFAVIGAGLSGLAAAHRMRRAGHEVVVIEAQDHAGGRCKVETRDGFIIDTGPELVASSYHHWLALARDMGLDKDLINAPTVLGIIKHGKSVEIDLGTMRSLLTSPLLSFGAKLRMFTGGLRLARKIRAVPTFLLEATALDEVGRTAMDVSRAAFGDEVTDQFIDPMLRPIGGTRLDLLSTLLVPYVLSEWTRMMALRGGLQRLPMAVAATLDVRYNTMVDRVHSNADNVTIDLRAPDGATSTITADKCLITAQYDDAERIYPRFAEIAKGYSRDMQFLSMLDVKLAYAKRPATAAGMVMCPFKETKDINVISLSHNKAPDRVPTGHSLFSVFTEHLEFDRLNAMSDGEVLQLIQPQVEALFPEIRGHLLFTHIGRWRRVSMLPTPGFYHRTRQLWDAIGQEPRVHLGGDIVNTGAGMEGAVMGGDYAADRLMR